MVKRWLKGGISEARGDSEEEGREEGRGRREERGGEEVGEGWRRGGEMGGCDRRKVGGA